MVNTGINYRTDTPKWVLRETVAHSFVMVVVVVIYYYHSHSGKCHKIFLLTFPFLIHPAACIVRITQQALTRSLTHSHTLPSRSSLSPSRSKYVAAITRGTVVFFSLLRPPYRTVPQQKKSTTKRLTGPEITSTGITTIFLPFHSRATEDTGSPSTAIFKGAKGGRGGFSSIIAAWTFRKLV